MTADEVTIGEVVRQLAVVVARLDKISAQLDALPDRYVTRDLHDLAVGGLKVDIRRLDEESGQLSTRVDEAERRTDVRFRQAVMITLSSVVSPVVVGATLYLLGRLVGG